jgi:hypothetical protein
MKTSASASSGPWSPLADEGVPGGDGIDERAGVSDRLHHRAVPGNDIVATRGADWRVVPGIHGLTVLEYHQRNSIGQQIDMFRHQLGGSQSWANWFRQIHFPHHPNVLSRAAPTMTFAGARLMARAIRDARTSKCDALPLKAIQCQTEPRCPRDVRPVHRNPRPVTEGPQRDVVGHDDELGPSRAWSLAIARWTWVRTVSGLMVSSVAMR